MNLEGELERPLGPFAKRIARLNRRVRFEYDAFLQGESMKKFYELSPITMIVIVVVVIAIILGIANSV